MHPNHPESLLTHRWLGSIPTVSDWAGLEKGLRFGISKFPSDADAVGPRTSRQASTPYWCLLTLPTCSLFCGYFWCAPICVLLGPDRHTQISFPSYHGEESKTKLHNPLHSYNPWYALCSVAVWPWASLAGTLYISWWLSLTDGQDQNHQSSRERSHTLRRGDNTDRMVSCVDDDGIMLQRMQLTWSAALAWSPSDWLLV